MEVLGPEQRDRSPERRVAHDPVIEYLEWLMERSIPIGSWSFGLDGILGLIPGFGDLAAGVVSAFIVGRAAKAGGAEAALARVMAKVCICTFLRRIPPVWGL